MVEEAASASEASVTEVVQTTLTEPAIQQTLEPNQASIEATLESSVQGGGTDSTCNNNNNNAADSAATDVCDEEREKTLEFADELTEQASAFLKDQDFGEAVDCFSRALEIRVAHYGELDPECINAYYRYGSALLEKAQAEADPLGNMPKKEGEAQQESSNKDDSVKNTTANGEALAAASVVSTDPERQGSSSGQEGSGGKDQVEDGEDCQDDDLSDADGDEDDSDLDMAWKMLDIARAITDKQSTDTMVKVDILCALAEISLEREDIESSLSDYKKALSIVERLVEPDSRHTAELNFRICICLETGCQPKEAMPYCQKAILICKARMERLSNEIKAASGSTTSSTVSEIDEGIQQSSNVPYIDKSASDKDKEAEIEVMAGLAEDLEKKLEDLKQQAENPKQVLAELMGMPSAKANASEKAVPATAEMSSSRMGTANTNFGKDLESPTVSTAHTGAAAAGVGASSGVTHLGVVGRGVKRVLMNATSIESSASKRPATEPSDKARPSLEGAFKKLGYSGPVSITAYGDQRRTPDHLLRGLSSTGVNVAHTIPDVTYTRMYSDHAMREIRNPCDWQLDPVTRMWGRNYQPEYATAKIAVWWDINDCPIPEGYDARRVRPSIEGAFKKLGYSGPVSITAYGDQTQTPAHLLRGLSSTGVSVAHTMSEISRRSHSKEIINSLPTLHKPDYFMKPTLNELVEREFEDPGYCSRVPDFTIGRIGYGFIKFLGNTDVRRLDLDQIVKFQRHEVIVYNDDSSKPVVGERLNKPAEVTLIVNIPSPSWGKEQADQIAHKLKQSTERQGATFISFDPHNGVWKFLAPHFSRFGLSYGGKRNRKIENIKKGSIEIWWDHENAEVPHDLPPQEVFERLKQKLRDEGFTGHVNIKIIVSYKDSIPPKVIEGLYSGVHKGLEMNFQHKAVYDFNRPSGPTRKQIADEAIKDGLRYSLEQDPNPRNIMVISGDGDFENLLQKALVAGHNTMIAYCDSADSVQAKKYAMFRWKLRELFSLPLNILSRKTRQKIKNAEFIKKKTEAAELEKKRAELEKKRAELEKNREVVPDIIRIRRLVGQVPPSSVLPVDDASLEYDRLSERVRACGLLEVKVQGDGNCQFRAISDQLYGSDRYHEEVRNEIVIQLTENREMYKSFDEDYDGFCESIARAGEWGKHLSLQAAADRFAVRIFLLTSMRDVPILEISPREGQHRRDLWLSYWQEMHYNSLYNDQGDSEKLNLDRSSGDESMEDEPETKQTESITSDDKSEKIEMLSKGESRADIDAGKGKVPGNKSHPLVASDKRKLPANVIVDQEAVGNNEPAKRRRWNSESIKIPEVQATNSAAPTITPRFTGLKRDFSRSDSSASEDGPKERVVPPSPKEPTNSLRIDRFLRPFTLKAVQELLGKTGNVTSFWMDQIKTHCYVSYSSVEEAAATRQAVYNLQWPPNEGRFLTAEFVGPEEVKAKLEAPLPPPPPQPQHQPQAQAPSRPPPTALPPPPPLAKPPQIVERLPPLPPLVSEEQEPPIVTPYDLFKKTKAIPRIYYLPLSEEQVAAKLAANNNNK